MPESANNQSDPSPDDEGTDDQSPDQKGTETPDEIALARRRQAGAEAARQVAEGKYAAAQKELDAFRAKNQTDEQKDLSEVARLTAQLEAAEARAADAEINAKVKVLDAQFPHARAEYPEITDEVKLARLEALTTPEEVGSEPPTPRGNNPPRAGQRPPAKAPTIADLEADLRRQVAGIPGFSGND